METDEESLYLPAQRNLLRGLSGYHSFDQASSVSASSTIEDETNAGRSDDEEEDIFAGINLSQNQRTLTTFQVTD